MTQDRTVTEINETKHMDSSRVVGKCLDAGLTNKTKINILW